ncbi:Chemotaxis phosphatase CheX [Caloranaerobacter azorensis DSM 13643]|uniref:Chemotaxis phosphatase CheX n=1 Tax=Caloranaerobacter azorensis DSM 13643 TaxID=1121264 RepID=A0A1M5UBR6_9FIRM|nr:chemotaxis protein CheX [Caloranaerobacter azorensis]SHH60444.1 Chemotaxis phosphatase CheX [Caloranaerobacter azorensis DSM 13643]
MDDIIISALIKSGQEIFSQAIRLFVEIEEPYIKKEVELKDDIGIITGLSGNLKGQIIIKLSESISKNIVSSILNDIPIAELDASCVKILCDMNNMLICNAISDIYNTGIAIDLSISALIYGQDIKYIVSDEVIYCIPFKAGNDIIEVNIILKDNDDKNL